MYLCNVNKTREHDMDKEVKKQLVMRLMQLKMQLKMQEHTFKNAGHRMSEKEMNELLDAKNATDKQIALIEKILNEEEK